MSADPAAIPFMVTTHASQINALDKAVELQGLTLATHNEQIADHAKSIDKLASFMDKVVWALVGFSFTVAASAVTLAVTIASG